MARKTLLPPLALSDESKKLLTDLSGSMTAPAREVIRAKVLLHYANGENISSISGLSESAGQLFTNASVKPLQPEPKLG